MTPSSPLPDDRFSQEDLNRVLASTFVDRIEHLSEVGSTNTCALDLAAQLPAAGCTLILADRQTAGRGRGDNRWWSSDGALTFSMLLKSTSITLPSSSWPQLSLAAGLAVCNAVEELVPDVSLNLKWPNDVYLGGRKLSGILAEATNGHERSIVVGIGVNVGNSVMAAPAEIRDRAVALCDVAKPAPCRVDVLIAILKHLAARLERLHSPVGSNSLRHDWRRRCLLTGRTVQLRLPLREVVGACRGVDDDGALLLETDAGVERFVSGVVVRFD